jgi:hypothetical protein
MVFLGDDYQRPAIGDSEATTRDYNAKGDEKKGK